MPSPAASTHPTNLKPESMMLIGRNRLCSRATLSLGIALLGSVLSNPVALMGQPPQKIPTAPAQGEATQGTSDAEADLAIALAIADLGDSNFEKRELASATLIRFGERSLNPLRQAKLNQDRETQERAEALIVSIEEGIKKRIINRFLQDRDPNNTYGLKGWLYFGKHVGNSRKAKELFLEAQRQYPELTAAWDEAPDQVPELALRTAEAIGARNVQFSDPTLADGAALFASMYDPEVAKIPAVHDAALAVAWRGEYKMLMLAQTGSTPVRKLFGHWLTVVNDSNAQRAMYVARETSVPEGIVLSRRLLAGEATEEDLTLAVSIIFSHGTKEDCALLEKYLSDETEIHRIELSDMDARNLQLNAGALPLQQIPLPEQPPEPIKPPRVYVAQKRDVALAGLLYLSGEDVMSFFPLMGERRPSSISINDVAFPEDEPERRKKAIEAWNNIKSAATK